MSIVFRLMVNTKTGNLLERKWFDRITKTELSLTNESSVYPVKSVLDVASQTEVYD